jgi:hypothetical protein
MEEAFSMCTPMKILFLKTIFSNEHEKKPGSRPGYVRIGTG